MAGLGTNASCYACPSSTPVLALCRLPSLRDEHALMPPKCWAGCVCVCGPCVQGARRGGGSRACNPPAWGNPPAPWAPLTPVIAVVFPQRRQCSCGTISKVCGRPGTAHQHVHDLRQRQQEAHRWCGVARKRCGAGRGRGGAGVGRGRGGESDKASPRSPTPLGHIAWHGPLNGGRR